MTRVKICGITNVQDAVAAAVAGADALGFVMEPSSPRCVAGTDLGWLDEVDPLVTRVGVFGPFLGLPEGHRFDAVQCFDPPADIGARLVLPVVRLARGSRAEDVALPGSSTVVLDALVPGHLGGAGQTVDWDLAAALVERWWSVRFVLAGGLTPENVAEAVRAVRPYAVDVSSGVERAPGRKDPDLVARFIQAAKTA